MTADADRLLDRPGDTKPFRVVCKRFDGRDREYQRYQTQQLAEMVARRLRAVGLEARIECASALESIQR